MADFTLEEIETAVAGGARARAIPVAAHAYGGEGLENAVAAGVRSIEHGGFLTEEQARRMAEAGCFLVPTLSAMRDTLDLGRAGDADAGAVPQDPRLRARSSARRCRSRRPTACRWRWEPTTSPATSTAATSRSSQLMHAAGLSLEETLLVATAGGAELCGVADQLGRIAPGYVFDAVLLAQEPGDLARLGDDVAAVFKAGRPVRVEHGAGRAGAGGAGRCSPGRPR